MLAEVEVTLTIIDTVVPAENVLEQSELNVEQVFTSDPATKNLIVPTTVSPILEGVTMNVCRGAAVVVVVAATVVVVAATVVVVAAVVVAGATVVVAPATVLVVAR